MAKKLKPKKSAWPACLNKTAATSEPLQSLCWVVQNLRGERRWQWPGRAVLMGMRAQKAFWLMGIHDMKVGGWTPYAVCEGGLTPGEDDSQKPECWAGTCLSKPVVPTGETDFPVTPSLKASQTPSSGQRADMAYGSPSKPWIMSTVMCQIFRMSPDLQFVCSTELFAFSESCKAPYKPYTLVL